MLLNLQTVLQDYSAGLLILFYSYWCLWSSEILKNNICFLFISWATNFFLTTVADVLCTRGCTASNKIFFDKIQVNGLIKISLGNYWFDLKSDKAIVI